MDLFKSKFLSQNKRLTIQRAVDMVVMEVQRVLVGLVVLVDLESGSGLARCLEQPHPDGRVIDGNDLANGVVQLDDSSALAY
ncbi:hypothetical protein Tco_0349129 [Tanacetum coccineum]